MKLLIGDDDLISGTFPAGVVALADDEGIRASVLEAQPSYDAHGLVPVAGSTAHGAPPPPPPSSAAVRVQAPVVSSPLERCQRGDRQGGTQTGPPPPPRHSSSGAESGKLVGARLAPIFRHTESPPSERKRRRVFVSISDEEEEEEEETLAHRRRRSPSNPSDSSLSSLVPSPLRTPPSSAPVATSSVSTGLVSAAGAISVPMVSGPPNPVVSSPRPLKKARTAAPVSGRLNSPPVFRFNWGSRFLPFCFPQSQSFSFAG